MLVIQRLQTRYTLDGEIHTADTLIEQVDIQGEPHFRALLEGTPLHETFGGTASSVELALDFLNLAMQAEGAGEIHTIDFQDQHQ